MLPRYTNEKDKFNLGRLFSLVGIDEYPPHLDNFSSADFGRNDGPPIQFRSGLLAAPNSPFSQPGSFGADGWQGFSAPIGTAGDDRPNLWKDVPTPLIGSSAGRSNYSPSSQPVPYGAGGPKSSYGPADDAQPTPWWDTLTPLIGAPDGGSIPSVPELSTWAMLLFGFAGIGFMAYRRKSKPALIATGPTIDRFELKRRLQVVYLRRH